MAKSKARSSTKTKKERKIVQQGKVFIQATFNNTIVTITDNRGNTLSWCSSGSLNFRGAKKSTPFAAQLVTETAAKKAVDNYGLNEVEVFVKGPGVGRESAIRSLDIIGIKVKSIKDLTPIPHNGCRAKKRRRV